MKGVIMTRHIPAVFLIASIALTACPPRDAAHAASAPSTIEVWTRASRSDVAGRPTGRERVQHVDLDALPLKEVTHVDVQYAGAFPYRGIPLGEVIRLYGPTPGVDLALLHFANGMQIPFAFRDEQWAKRLDPFLARGIRLGPGQPLRVGWFPNISQAREGFVDVRPITFVGNKLVVSDVAHPAVPAAAQTVLSPWLHADSLTGIELCSAKAYYAQFDVDPDPGVRAGYRLFLGSCQFCHGARGTGAAFGWDFVEPTPVFSYRGEKNLFYHVKFKPPDAASKGMLMPALSYMTEADAHSIWLWLRAIATRPMPAYTRSTP
jgi:mono/diheme cytochrome c family protein